MMNISIVIMLASFALSVIVFGITSVFDAVKEYKERKFFYRMKALGYRKNHEAIVSEDGDVIGFTVNWEKEER